MKGFKKENKKLRVRHSGSSVMTGLGRGGATEVQRGYYIVVWVSLGWSCPNGDSRNICETV